MRASVSPCEGQGGRRHPHPRPAHRGPQRGYMDRGATATAAIIDDLKRRQVASARYLGIDGGTNCKLALLEAAGDRHALAGDGHDPDRPRRPRRGGRAARGHGDEADGRARAGGGGRGGRPRAVRRGVGPITHEPAARLAGYEFAGLLAERLGVRTALINDARSFTLAESRMGAAAGYATVVCVTLGTGVGGGVVVDGRLRFGLHGRAGELGHQVIDLTGPAAAAATGAVSRRSWPAPAICRLGGWTPRGGLPGRRPRRRGGCRCGRGRRRPARRRDRQPGHGLVAGTVVVGGGVAAGDRLFTGLGRGRPVGATGRPGLVRDRAGGARPGRRRHRRRPVGLGATEA